MSLLLETSGVQTRSVSTGRNAQQCMRAEQGTYRNQSTAMISVISSVGSPTDVSTITIVTSPAWGIPAAPMLAAVAVMLEGTGKQSYQQREEKRWSHVQKCQEVAQTHLRLGSFSALVTKKDGDTWNINTMPDCPCQTPPHKKLHTTAFPKTWTYKKGSSGASKSWCSHVL